MTIAMAEIAAITAQLRMGSIDFTYLDKAGIIPIPFTSPQRSLSYPQVKHHECQELCSTIYDFAQCRGRTCAPRRSCKLKGCSIGITSLIL